MAVINGANPLNLVNVPGKLLAQPTLNINAPMSCVCSIVNMVIFKTLTVVLCVNVNLHLHLLLHHLHRHLIWFLIIVKHGMMDVIVVWFVMGKSPGALKWRASVPENLHASLILIIIDLSDGALPNILTC